MRRKHESKFAIGQKIMKANYFKFGVFLVIATTLLVAAVVILGAGLFAPAGERLRPISTGPSAAWARGRRSSCKA
jgi:hypothetical protein